MKEYLDFIKSLKIDCEDDELLENVFGVLKHEVCLLEYVCLTKQYEGYEFSKHLGNILFAYAVLLEYLVFSLPEIAKLDLERKQKLM